MENKIEQLLGFKPCKLYYNLHLIDIQLKIREQNKQKAGIYMLYNNINNKFYIGSASTNRINFRFRNHCIHGTGSKLTNAAVKKYGLENFWFIILKYYPGFVKKENLDRNHLDLLRLETEFIVKLNPEYNILQSGINNLGSKHEEEVNIAMKLNDSQEWKDRIKNLNLGRTFTEERINLLSKLAKIRNLNIKLREKLAESSSKPVILYNVDKSIHSKYSSISNMAKAFKCCNKTINKAIKNKSIFKGIGFITLDRKE